MASKNLEYIDHKPFITVKSEDGTENTYYSILCENLPEEMLRKAREEVKETEEKKKKGMTELKQYMKKEKMLDFGDEYVIAALRCCKYDIKKAKVKLAKFVKIYERTISKLSKLDMDKVDSFISEMGFGMLPYRDREGRIIAISRWFSQITSYETELIDACFVAATMVFSTLPMASLLGGSIITEGKVPEMRYFYTIIRLFIRSFPEVIQMPQRIGSIKVVNEHYLVRFLYRIIRPLVPYKIQKRVCFLGTGYEELHKDYPAEILPQELGGYLGPMSADVYKQRILNRLKYEIEKAKCSSVS